MPKFNYVVTDQAGRKKEGVIKASTKAVAITNLKKEGTIILSLSEFKEKWGINTFMRPSMGTQEKMLFISNLSTMVKVGVTITESFDILIEQTSKGGAKTILKDILDMLNSGQTLAKSLRKYDYIFSELFINMIETGEKSGNLDKSLEYLNIQLDKEATLRKTVISALIYPAVIVSITLLMAIGIVIFIMPKISKIFESFNITLPLPTRFLIGFSKVLTEQTLLAVSVTVGAVVFFIFIFKFKAFKPFWHRLVINLPIFGGLLIDANVARFSRTLNSLIQAGTSITESVKITARMLDNKIYQRAISKAADKVERGGMLGVSLEEYGKLFPPLATKIIYIGEKTGTLEATTEKVAETFEKRVDAKTKSLTVLLEPLLLVMMAGLVGGIAMSIILPIYQLPNLLSQ